MGKGIMKSNPTILCSNKRQYFVEIPRRRISLSNKESFLTSYFYLFIDLADTTYNVKCVDAEIELVFR